MTGDIDDNEVIVSPASKAVRDACMDIIRWDDLDWHLDLFGVPSPSKEEPTA